MIQAESRINVQGLTDYEIVQTMDAFVCDLITYLDQDLAAYPGTLQGYAPESYTVYSAFQNGSPVCEGYARTTMLLLNDFHIKTDFLIGDCYNGGGHAWNMVYLDDAWYHLDVCWNDGSQTKDYFLVSDDFMDQSRTWDRSIYPVSAMQNYKY